MEVTSQSKFRRFNSDGCPIEKVGFEGHDDTWLAHQDDFQVSLHYDHDEHDEHVDHDDHNNQWSLTMLSPK